MKLQVLVAAMNQKDHSLLEKMNIKADVIVGNQCDHNSVELFDYHGHTAMYLNFAERGIGLNRNNALLHANGDIVLFADDDVIYNDDCVDIILNEYAKNDMADVIVFNLMESRNGEPLHRRINYSGKVGRRQISSYATFMITARLGSIRKKNVFFSHLFGGGAKFSCGEDSIFLKDCYDSGMKIYSSEQTIGTVIHNDSTWFRGYIDKYFYDKGALFGYMYPRTVGFLACYHVIKHRNLYKEYGLKRAIIQILNGKNALK